MKEKQENPDSCLNESNKSVLFLLYKKIKDDTMGCLKIKSFLKLQVQNSYSNPSYVSQLLEFCNYMLQSFRKLDYYPFPPIIEYQALKTHL